MSQDPHQDPGRPDGHKVQVQGTYRETTVELRQLRGLSSATARQLFSSTVAPEIDYASNFWMHSFEDNTSGQINQVQRIRAQATVGPFLIVAANVADAEAHIVSAQQRIWRRAVKMWTVFHALPKKPAFSAELQAELRNQEIPSSTAISGNGRFKKH